MRSVRTEGTSLVEILGKNIQAEGIGHGLKNHKSLCGKAERVGSEATAQITFRNFLLGFYLREIGSDILEPQSWPLSSSKETSLDAFCREDGK